MLRKSNNVFAALLSDGTLDATSTAILPADGDLVTNDSLAAGAVCFVTKGMRRDVYADIATGDQYAIVQSLGPNKPLMRSPMITKGKETITSQKFVPSVQQVTMVGYNGASGSLPAANSTEYYIRLKKNDNNGRDNSQGTSKFAGPIKTDATATQTEVAKELIKSGIKNFDLEADKYVKFEMLNAGARTAAHSGGAHNITFTKGSKTVTCANAAGIANVVVGDYIASAQSTATTVAVYKVTAKPTSTTLTLGWAFQGETVTFAVNVNIRVVAATADAAASGVQITGIENAFDVSKWRNYYVNRFTANFFGGTATLTSSVGAKTGTGTWQQVAMDEYMNYGFEGQGTIGTPPTIRESVVKIPGVGSETALTSKYSVINIAWTEDIDGLVSTGKGKGNVLLYLNLVNDSGVGKLATSTDNPGEVLAAALGITASTLDEA